MPTRYGDTDMPMKDFLRNILHDAKSSMLIIKGFSFMVQSQIAKDALSQEELVTWYAKFDDAVGEIDKIFYEIYEYNEYIEGNRP